MTSEAQAAHAQAAQAQARPGAVAAWRQRLADGLEQRPRLRRELYFAGGALLVGLVIVPIMIYVAGAATLGDYASGGFWSFLGDFYVHFFTGSPAAWVVALGPYALVLLLRGTRFVMRRLLADPPQG
jgi:hypothetical protein